ncbi:lipoate--protein ligase [Cuneatibacter sp. NSJ-177]|uniref:lipoate--protein ligase n=1 Tax=Cuneatibacter sp. NSJ-177 TaxID=2931401 RepID=UPI00245730BD|nr:lipoate--protein ligase [Cuneatibacter sp. NSJ-177]
MKYYQNPCTDPCYNLALEEYLLNEETTDDFFLLWQNRPSVILGLNQNALEEIREDEVSLRGISVVRRTTGGGAVYHDLGNLNFSFFTDFSPEQPAAMRQFLEPVTAYLCSLGLPAAVDGRNDIVVSGRKVSGSAQRINGGRILHHGTLLFDSDLSALSRVLKPRDDKFQSKSTKSVRSRVANIRKLLSVPVTLNEFRDGLVQWLTRDRPVSLWTPSSSAVRKIRLLAQEKYASKSWNYGSAPACTFRNQKRFPGGSLEILFEITENRIEHAGIYGDFLATEDSSPLLQALGGIPYQKEEVQSALSPLPLHRYLGGISLEEFLSVCFPSEPPVEETNFESKPMAAMIHSPYAGSAQ